MRLKKKCWKNESCKHFIFDLYFLSQKNGADKMKNTLCNLALIVTSALILTSCYKMPSDDDYSTIPTTNNPDLTREKNDSMMPGLGY
jgi:hypothetical protein